MPLTQRCNYAGSLGKPVPTLSFLSSVSRRLRGLMVPASLPMPLPVRRPRC